MTDDDLALAEAARVGEPGAKGWGGRAHRRLPACQESVGQVKRLYQATAGFPAAELYGLTAQTRSAAVSVPANIAEGAGRGSQRELRRYLIIARGSLSELDTLLTIAHELGYLSSDAHAGVQVHLDKVSKLLSGLVATLPGPAGDAR